MNEMESTKTYTLRLPIRNEPIAADGCAESCHACAKGPFDTIEDTGSNLAAPINNVTVF